MNAVPLSLQMSEAKFIKASVPSSASMTNETIDFAELLTTVSAKTAEMETPDERQKDGLLEKLEQVLADLQVLPQENLTPEQQEIMQSIMQLLVVQTQPIEGQLQEVTLGQETLSLGSPLQEAIMTEMPVKNHSPLSHSAYEKLAADPSVQEKLMGLLQEAVQELQKLAETGGNGSEKIQQLATEGPETIAANPKKFEHAFQQVENFIEQLETEQQEPNLNAAGKQVQQLEELLKQVTGLKQEPLNFLQTKEAETVIPLFDETLPPVIEPKVSQKELQEPQLTEETNLPMAGSEAPKAGLVAVRAEPNASQPIVRMSNIVEEMGEVLNKGSFRLNGNGDSTQIKISIFPEHLGHVEIKLTAIDGKIVAQLFTSTLAAKEALDQQAGLLRSSMLQQGIIVEKIEIAQQSSQQSFGQQNTHPDQRFSHQQKQGQIARMRNGYQQIEEETAAIVRQQSNERLMKVDYTI